MNILYQNRNYNNGSIKEIKRCCGGVWWLGHLVLFDTENEAPIERE